MRKCDFCSYIGTAWLQNNYMEVHCPHCRKRQVTRFVEEVAGRYLTYLEAIQLYDKYEQGFIQHHQNVVTSWAELDVMLNESISRKIRKVSA